MSSEVSALTSAQSKATNVVMERRSAEFHPSVWGDYFLNYNALGSTTDNEQHIEKLKMEVKGMLTDAEDLDKLTLIDQIQRLGIGYKFDNEIDEILEQIFYCYFKCDSSDYEHDMHTTALLFRLLRQQGYRIPCDVFNKFKDNEGKFSETLVKDVRGLLSLYEASHLRVHGENILDEALTFSVHHLELAVEDGNLELSPSLVVEVKHALKQCIRKGLPRLEAWHYIRIYEQDASHNEVLLKLAKLDFNLLQKLHQKELSETARWWKDHIDIERNFPYARDRIVECYFWILGVYFEPEFSQARAILAKIISLISVMDDTYDVYGTLEELQLLTDAINRWDMGAIHQLPQYLQIFYKELLDTYIEIEKELTQRGKTYRFIYAKESMQNSARAYFKEARWFHENYVPTIEEYIPLALETSGYDMLAISSFLGMGDVASEDAFEWVLSDPKIIHGSKVVGRFMDDIVSHKFEQKRGHVASAIECYVKHHGMTEQHAEKVMWKMVDDAWKDINEDCLRPTPVPMPLLLQVLNLARVIEVLYKGRDGYTDSRTETKEFVAALLVNPILL